jgi:hypothetical protein
MRTKRAALPSRKPASAGIPRGNSGKGRTPWPTGSCSIVLALSRKRCWLPTADHELERHDKQAADLLGEYIYSFSREGRRVVGISWAGAKRLAQKYLPGLEVELVRVDTTDKWIAVVVKAKTERGSALGAAQVPASERFAYTIAINKAQRNAIMNLLDEAVIKHALEEYLQDSRLSRSS